MKNLKKINYGLYIVYAITLIYAYYENFITNDMNGVGMCLVSTLLPLLVPVAFKLFKWKHVDEIDTIAIIFIYFASLIGSCLGGYSITGFDKVLHFSSGLFATLIAIILYIFIKKETRIEDKQERTIFYIFINAVNLSIAIFWEFYEFAMLVFFNNDCINHYSTGVYDSITDILCAFIGGLIVFFIVYKYYKTNKKTFFINLYEKFYLTNIKK
ncbi:MAG: hypothetical protein RR646_03610 [Erysipelotrichaceae bacterium]